MNFNTNAQLGFNRNLLSMAEVAISSSVQSNILNINRWPHLALTCSVLATWMGELWGKTLITHGWGRGRRWQGKKSCLERYSWFSLSLFWSRPGIYQLAWKLDKEGNLVNTRQGLARCRHCDDIKEVVETVLTTRVWNSWESVRLRFSLSAEQR